MMGARRGRTRAAGPGVIPTPPDSPIPKLMKNQNEFLHTWLRDAHAMETNLESMLKKQADRFDDAPLRARIAAHAEETRRHAEKIERCLESLGESTSAFKEAMAKLTGKSSPVVMSANDDEPVKVCLTCIAAEHFEIACYRSLQAAAVECGEPAVSQIAEEILREEESMAKFLEENLTRITRSFLQQQGQAVRR